MLIVSGELNNGWWGWWMDKDLMKENLSGRLRVEPDQVMGHLGLKTDLSKFTVQVIIQHCKAVQPHTTNSWLAKSPLRSQTTYRVVIGLGKRSQQKQTTQTWMTLIVKFDNVFMKLCVCEEKSNLQSWAIRPVFIDPVAYM